MPTNPAKQQLPKSFQEVDRSTLENKAEKELKDFSDLLDTISSVEDKKKSLWKLIFENSITDRNNACVQR